MDIDLVFWKAVLPVGRARTCGGRLSSAACVTPETLPPDRNPPLARPKYNLADAGMFMFSPKWLWFFYTAVKCI